jgi:hypothetical protein
MPVVKSRALELSVVDGKTHWLDDVQSGAGSGTGTRDIAGILRDFRLMQNNVDFFHKYNHGFRLSKAFLSGVSSQNSEIMRLGFEHGLTAGKSAADLLAKATKPA